MAITGVDSMVAALAAAPVIPFLKNIGATKAVATYQSAWAATGLPGAGATPGNVPAGVVPTSATAGALKFTNPAGGALTYLGLIVEATQQIGVAVLYDRLVHTSGIVGNITTSQTVGTPAITRPDALGAAVEGFIEWYTATGASASNITITYTNQDGAGGQTTTFALQQTPTIGQMQPIPLASGDTGIRSVQSVQLSATTGTAGNFGITLLRRIDEVGAPAGVLATHDYLGTGSSQVPDSACLAFAFQANGAATVLLTGHLKLPQG